ncbi:MAG TPA: transglycosylase domain-containing protein [Chitinophagales bacterium]|nr:transglycosylase domain-containing protein [Chitinophagales bacterium]MCB9074199.1 transglycosylase domain-containing protein [Chitinophagales bacterium]HMU97819.1 transglycosylase domain-containing protein [Chitinophagales bacterium]HMV02889.1 transglycosylase domain-containing protein [Chitinophagales bacterium]HMW94048.1 transglycosylase domain-containing protein [Chitinophagales bacterium]
MSNFNISPKIIWKFFFAGLGFVFLFFLLIRIGLFGKLPSFEEIENPNSNLASEIYSADSVLIGKFYVNNRSNVSFDQLSPWLEKALISTEDKRFYEHSGIDIFRTFKAVFTLGQDGGGSTITQQLAKNMFHKRGGGIITRVIQKAKEYVIAVMLERRYTKEEIIAMYFNTFDFVNNAIGIESASRIYFNKQPKDLNIEEAAMFVGMLQNPSLYNPNRNETFRKRCEERRSIVLRLMRDNGHISNAQLSELLMKPIELNFHPESASDGLAPYFRQTLAEYLKKWAKENKKPDGTSYNIYTDGLKIYTTLDTRMQKHAEEATVEHLRNHQKIIDAQFRSGWNPWKKELGQKILLSACKNTPRWRNMKAEGMSDDAILEVFKTQKNKMTVFSYNGMKDTTFTPYDSVRYYKSFLQVGFMVMEPNTGYVKAWVGGPNFNYFKVDHCNTQRQVGSTFKPIVYALAVDNGWSPCMVVTPGKVTIGNWSPRGGSGGPQTLKHALTKSDNQVAAYITLKFGVSAIIDMSRKMGIVSDLPPYAPISLGASDITLSEMMTVYSTFPNAGISTKPQFLVRIEDKDGNIVQNFTTEMREVLSDNIAYKMVDMLKGPVGPGGTGGSLRGRFGLGDIKNICGKTGTTNNNTDGWFIGFTPQLVAGAWVGCDDPILHFLTTGNGMGAASAMPIFGKFMYKAYNDPKLKKLKKDMDFFIPSDAELAKNVCSGDEVETDIYNSTVGGNTDAVEENYDTEYKF